MLRRIWAIIQKEFIQLTRERVYLIAILFAPLIETVFFATAIHTDIQHIPMVVADQSLSAESRSYLNALVHSDAFDIVASVSSQSDLVKTIDRGQASLGVLIPPDFASQVMRRQANVLMLVDGSSSFTSSSAYGMANAITQSYAIGLLQQRPLQQPLAPLNLHLRILYNPDANQMWFIIPGLMAVMVQGLALNLTTFAVVREREVGTIEALLVTPIRPVELMLGKTIPNLIIALTSIVSMLIFSTLVMGVPFRGSLPLFFALAILFGFAGLGMGLVVSVLAQNQFQAQLMGMILNFSAFFLAGFFFPNYALPPFLRLLSYILPMTYFLPIVRGIMIKGIGITAIWGGVAASLVLATVILFIASHLFRESLD